MRCLTQRVCWTSLVLTGVVGACGGNPPQQGTTVGSSQTAEDSPTRPPESPPESGPARDVSFPAIATTETENGLSLNTVQWHQLPIVYLRLVIRSGEASDPENLPGLAHLATSMLQEGTRGRTSAELAEAVEFLGAQLDAYSGEETITITMRALSQHLPQAMAILAEVTMSPAFSNSELEKLKRREVDRLSLRMNEPGFLGEREFYRALYGNHPYANIETTKEVLDRVNRRDLTRFHAAHFVPNNAFLVVVGDVTPEQVQEQAANAFGRWRRKDVPQQERPSPPERQQRRAIVVDRPESVQSLILIGNLAMKRSDPEYIPFRVANQVLGGSATSRLFMDLRERQGLTYGAYSYLSEKVDLGPFTARASVKNEATAAALSSFFGHFSKITSEEPEAEELANAKRFLSDSFPLRIETPGYLASLVTDLRIHNLPDDYWDSFRTSIGQVTAEQALAAARNRIHHEQALIVVVGKAAELVDTLRPYGPVTVVDLEGNVTQNFDAANSE